MTAFDKAWGMVRKSTPLQEEIENQKELGMEVNVKTGDVHNPDMSQALYNLYDYYDQDTGEKIEKSEFNKAWGIVKGDEDEWDGFNPDHDTCTGCGGQMTPHWPGYGPNGPENGNCDHETPECDVRYMLDMQDRAKPTLFFPKMGYESLIEMIHRERKRGNHDFPDEYNPLRNHHEGLAESRSESYANRE